MNIKDFSNKMEEAQVEATMCQAGIREGDASCIKTRKRIRASEPTMVAVTMLENNVDDRAEVRARAARIAAARNGIAAKKAISAYVDERSRQS